MTGVLVLIICTMTMFLIIAVVLGKTADKKINQQKAEIISLRRQLRDSQILTASRDAELRRLEFKIAKYGKTLEHFRGYQIDTTILEGSVKKIILTETAHYIFKCRDMAAKTLEEN